jgi:hypothetical protein
MSIRAESSKKPASLEKLLKQHDEKLQKLFIKVMNLHAGHQVGVARSASQVVGEVRKDIEHSLS